jgi:hypothetical protein
LINDPGRVRTRTSVEGYYQLGIKAAGTYYVAATAPNYNGSADQTAVLAMAASVVKKDFTLQTAGFNWALLSTATCASGYYAPDPPNLAVDGDLTSEFATLNLPAPLVVDLGSAKTIGEAAFYWETGYGTAFTIDYSSDNSNWTTVKTVGASTGGFTTDYYVNTGADNTAVPKQKTGYQVVSFTPHTARYWRINTSAVGGSTYETIWELQLRDSTIPSVPPTAGGARNAPVGGGIIVNTAVVTAMPGAGLAAGNICVESADRSAGIRVDVSGITDYGTTLASIGFGDTVSIIGRAQVSNGEKYIAATSLARIASGQPVVALGINNRDAETTGQGLFVKTG